MSDEDCPREKSTQSTHSPNLVDDEETLLRSAYMANHIGPDGKLTTTNIQITQIIEPAGDGFSVDRLSYFLQKSARQREGAYNAKHGQDSFQGFFKARAGDIRALMHDVEGEEIRSFCVIDDGLIDNPAHALITPSKKFRISTTDRKEIKKASSRLRPLRAALIDLFDEMVTVEDIPSAAVS